MNKKFINAEQASELLNLSKSTIYKMTMAKAIPFYKPRGRLLFCPDELIDFVKNSNSLTKFNKNEHDDDAFLITSLAA
jgi:excisionase family DNA binding protein